MADEDEHKVITEKLDEILLILNGNGKTGLCAKVNILWGGSLFIIMSIAAIAVKAFMSGG